MASHLQPSLLVTFSEEMQPSFLLGGSYALGMATTIGTTCMPEKPNEMLSAREGK
jgi:hypothetical protein